MRVWTLAAAFIGAVFAGCPAGFDLVAKGQCRGVGRTMHYTYWQEALSEGVEICTEKQAKPIIIENDEQQAYWANIADKNPPPYLLTGVECKKNKHIWVDGTPITYKASEVAGSCNASCSWDIHRDGSWNYGCGKIQDIFDIYCIADLPKPEISFDDCTDFGGDQICYEISSTPGNWSEAQSTCKSLGAAVASIHSIPENNYIRRLAISRGLISGVLLGGSAIGASNQFQWIDGSRWDFANFIPGFPIDSFGSCLVMDTNDVNGEWANIDCSTRMPFVCARKPNASATCLGANVREGDIIASPGFPTDATQPCDFFLTVAAGKKVEVEIILLEANSCCDRLVLYEGTFGGSVIANLTGEISSKTYRTSSSNAMRASWQPKDGINVRGMMITYRAV